MSPTRAEVLAQHYELLEREQARLDQASGRHNAFIALTRKESPELMFEVSLLRDKVTALANDVEMLEAAMDANTLAAQPADEGEFYY